MCQVEFLYGGYPTIIQCNENEKMSDICTRFADKTEIDKKNIYFNYDGKAGSEFNEKLTFKQMINSLDKQRKKMTILVNDDTNNEQDKIIKSKEVICPKCGKNIKIKIKDYKITLYDCQDAHKISDLSLNEYEKTQKINLSKIICENCKINDKGSAYKYEFYKCLDCNINLCSLCKSKHDEDHNIINYDRINYTCPKHNDNYTKYCNKCKINICISCEEEHENHENIYFGKILPNKNELKEKLDELKIYVEKFSEDFKIIEFLKDAQKNFQDNYKIKQDYDGVIEILSEVKNNFNKYYEIKKDLINNFNKNERNYETLFNLKEISNNEDIKKDLNKINNENNNKEKFKTILDIYNKINPKNNLKIQNFKKEQELIKKNEVLEEEKEELLNKNQFLENEKEEMINYIKILEREKEELKNKIELLKRESNKFDKEIINLVKEINNLENEKLLLNKKCNNLEKEKEVLNKKSSNLEKDIEILNKKYNNLEKEKETFKFLID